jgi:hypothetical protein
MDQYVSANFKQQYLKFTSAKCMEASHGEDKNTIQDFWKGFNVRNATDSIENASVKSAPRV